MRRVLKLGRLLLLVSLASAVGSLGMALPAQAVVPPVATITVTCGSPVSYGDDVVCRAFSVDANGNFGVAGTFTFDAGHVMPGVWTTPTCQVSADSCSDDVQLTTPAAAVPATFTFPVSFTGTDGSTASTQISVVVGLRPTTTTVECDGGADESLGGVAHCVITVTDGLYSWQDVPAQLPPGVLGMTATSSDHGDVVTYDHPSAGGATCTAEVVAADSALECGFSIKLDSVGGLRTVLASYGGDPADDEVASQGSTQVSNGLRVAPVVTISCPASVPAEAPTTTCAATVSAAAGSAGPVPTGTVEFDQAFGQPAGWDSGNDCTLVAGSCSVPYEVFEGTEGYAAPPVRALYSGDGSYLPGSATEVVTVTPTPTVSTLTCDSHSPAASTAMHCTYSVSTADGLPAPVGPADAITIAASSGAVTCDQAAVVGCGEIDTATAAVAGFSIALGPSVGAQVVAGTYSGDQSGLVASSSDNFFFTAVAPPVLLNTPPQDDVASVPTRTSVSCGPSVAYRHATQCIVKVTAAGTVASGTVAVSPVVGHSSFPATSCTLGVTGRCAVTITTSALPPSTVPVTASYSGGDALQASEAAGTIDVRDVATSVIVRCAHSSVPAGAIVHCVASVRTEFGDAAAVPAASRSQVTVSARGDGIVYDGAVPARACHWKVVGHSLTCGFSVRAGRASGARTIRVHYAGGGVVRDAASMGSARLKVTVRR